MIHSSLLRTAAISLLSVALLAGAVAQAAGPTVVKVDGTGTYKLYLPVAAKGAKIPLVVWLHPSGAEANHLVTKWWPELHEFGYALMLPTTKDRDEWATEDLKSLFAYLDHAAKHHRTDPKKVVLLGYSGGSQVAFHLGMHYPERFAGIVTMSGVPVKDARDVSTPMPPKKFKDSLAYFMVVGEREQLAVTLSKRAQLEFLVAGFSALLHVVEQGGHGFHVSEKKNVLAWLEEIAAGKRPAEKELAELTRKAPELLKVRAEAGRLVREREEKRRREHEARLEKLRKQLTATAVKVHNDIEASAGKPYKLKWHDAGEVEQRGTLKVKLPQGWKLGKAHANGKSAAVGLAPPGEQHIVAILGRSVNDKGLTAHYQKWIEDMRRSKGMLLGKRGSVTLNGKKWQLLTVFLVPHGKRSDPAARRVLVIALLPLNEAGTEWRSLTVMCPEQDYADNNIAEVIRGVLEQTEFGDPPAKGK